MSYYLFLDDARKVSDVTWVTLPENVAWVIARSFEDFIQTIQKMGIPKFIAYDCDLCQDHYDAFFNLREHYITEYRNFKTRCGIHCMEYLLYICKKNKIKHPDFILHTRNHYAEKFMGETIQKFNDGIEYFPDTNLDIIPTPIPPYARHDAEYISGFFGPYRFLSNFWPAPVTYEGVLYPSTEVAYQAAKCVIRKDRELFIHATSSEAKQIGKRVIMRSDWDDVRESIMSDLVDQKFNKHIDLRDQLLATNKKQLVEANTWKDTFWGVYYKYQRSSGTYECLGGQNKLGEILMKVRATI